MFAPLPLPFQPGPRLATSPDIALRAFGVPEVSCQIEIERKRAWPPWLNTDGHAMSSPHSESDSPEVTWPGSRMEHEGIQASSIRPARILALARLCCAMLSCNASRLVSTSRDLASTSSELPGQGMQV